MSVKHCVLLLAVVGLVASCGVSTHIEIAYRAMTSLPNGELSQIISNNLDAFQAGAPYPDSYYDSICYNGVFAGVSEDTHWTPWMRSAINYVRATYPKPWNATTQKLVAFLHGVASHQVADVVWHGSLTGVPNGFIDTEAWVDFKSQEQVAHSLVDPGGDVVANFELDLSYIALVEEWYVPVQDLVNIYQLYQKETGNDVQNINSTVIIECSTWMFLARLGERIAMALDYKNDLGNSTFLQEQYYQYYLGGVSNMHTVTQQYWQRMAVAIVNGTNQCTNVNNPVDFHCNGSVAAAPLEAKRYTSPRPPPLRVDKSRKAKVQYLPHGAISITNEVRGSDKFDPPSSEPVAPIKVVPKQVYSSTNAYAQAGEVAEFFDVNGDGFKDTIIGVPEYNPDGCANEGRVFILLNRNGSMNAGPLLEHAADIVLSPVANVMTCGGRFGFSLAALDVNKDGVADLLVGSPSLGIQNNSYYGAIYVYYGVKGGSIPRTPSRVVYGSGDKRNFGWKMTVGHLDTDGTADLVVASPYDPNQLEPQGGSVAVFLSIDFPFVTAQPSYILTGDKPHSWFGYDVHITKVNSVCILLIGAPYYDENGHGRVYAYGMTDLLFTIRGDHAYDRLGASIRTGVFGSGSGTQLVVGAVAASDRPGIAVKYTGRVYIFKASLWNATGIVNASAYASDQVDGVDLYQRVGWNVRVADVNNDKVDDLIVSSPLGYKDWYNIGSVFILYGGPNFLINYYSSSCGLVGTTPCIYSGADVTLASNVANDRYGYYVATSDVNNDGKADVFVFATMSSVGSRVGGSIYYYQS